MKEMCTNKNGSALLMTIMIMTSILTVALGMAAIVVPGILAGRTQIRSTKAYFAAESGAERVLWAVRSGNFNPTDLATCNLSNGRQYVTFGTPTVCSDILSPQGFGNYYTLPVNNSNYYLEFTSSSPIIFRSVGSNLGTSRIVEISF